jgi:hypothetical protein
METIIRWLERHEVPCFFKKCFGIECPGCGIQRAFVSLLKGNIWESFRLYPALIPMILMIILLFLHVIFNFKKGYLWLKILFFMNVILIFFNYLSKLFW